VDLDDLCSDWISLPELADRIGETQSRIRQWIRDGRLIVVERGTPTTRQVPAEFVHDGELLRGLGGAITVLADAGYSAEESMRWLLTDDPTLPGRPVELMAQGRHHAVKRRAMVLGF
jgi:hypothetical protein